MKLAKPGDTRWWRRDKDKSHDGVISALEQIIANDRGRRQLDERHAKLYAGTDLRGLEAGDYYRASDPSKLTCNVIQAVIDTAYAKVAKNRPRPSFTTDGADWGMRRRAKDLGRWSFGFLYQTQAYKEGALSFRDAEIVGTGAYKVFSENKQIVGERVFPWELHTDPVESVYGKPRQLFQSKLIDRPVLEELYPKLAPQIKAAKRHQGNVSSTQSLHDFIRVVEAWHLPSGPKAKDGRHVIAIAGATLRDDGWKRDHFPFAFSRWSERQVGFWGLGIAERLTGIQFEINTLLQKFQEIYAVWGKPWMMVERGSKVKKSHITDELDTILEYTGVKPTLEVFQLVSPEMYQHLLWLVQRAYEEVGVSLLSASMQKPAGLDAAVALREYNDIESERFVMQGKGYEDFFMDITKLGIEEAREIPDYTVRAAEKQRLYVFKWADVSLDEDAYVMQVFPTSSLPATPAGKRQEISEWIKMGLPPDEGMRLMDIPDLEAYRSRKFAGHDVVDQMVEEMLEDGVEHVPEPYMPLEYALQHAQDAYNYGKLHKAPLEHLALLQRWMVDCEEELKKKTAAPASAPGVPAVAPPMPAVPGPVQLPPTAGVPPGMPLQ